MRLILVFLASQDKVKSGDKEKRYEIAGLNAEQIAVIENMQCIGVTGENVCVGGGGIDKKLFFSMLKTYLPILFST